MTSKSNIGARLRACNCIEDAKAVLKETSASDKVNFLFDTAYAVRNNDITKSKLLEIAIQEAETEFKQDEDGKKLVESGDVQSGDGNEGSEQSSDVNQPYPKEGTDGEVTDMGDASGENQMTESLPTGGPGQLPPIAPELMQQIPQQLPQGITQPMLQQMQYTVREAMKPILAENKQLREAIRSIDRRLKETETLKGAMTLDVGEVKEHSIVRDYPLRETVQPELSTPAKQFPRFELESKRQEIKELNDQLNGEF